MSIHTVSSRDFTRDVAVAKRASLNAPVFITNRGRPAFELLRIERRFSVATRKVADLADLGVALINRWQA